MIFMLCQFIIMKIKLKWSYFFFLHFLLDFFLTCLTSPFLYWVWNKRVCSIFKVNFKIQPHICHFIPLFFAIIKAAFWFRNLRNGLSNLNRLSENWSSHLSLLNFVGNKIISGNLKTQAQVSMVIFYRCSTAFGGLFNFP